ncbi:MAG: hypothetical protein JW737_08990 [Acidobacteria bacterium]|nr:hypothetical protein [Acidobacteriota bacterium]
MTYDSVGYLKKRSYKKLYWILVVLMFVALIYYFGAPKVAERTLPVIKNAYIAVRMEGEPVSKTQNMLAVLPENVVMYAVLECDEVLSSEPTYYTTDERVIIGEKEIPSKQIDKWDSVWNQPVVGWIKIEPLIMKYDGRGQKDMTFLKFKHRWRFDGLSYWALSADAKPSIIIENEVQAIQSDPNKRFSNPSIYPGTMHFQLRAMLYGPDDQLNPLSEGRTPGEDSLGPEGFDDKMTRITFIEDKTFRGYCTGFFNLPYIEGNEELVLRTHATEKFFAIGDKSWVYEAAILSGYDVKERSIKGLKAASKLIQDNLYIKVSNYIYSEIDGEMKQIPFAENGVQPGDILIIGADRKMMVLYSDGGLSAKPDGLLDATDVVLATTKDGLEKEFLGNVLDDKFEIWRLVKKSGNE